MSTSDRTKLLTTQLDHFGMALNHHEAHKVRRCKFLKMQMDRKELQHFFCRGKRQVKLSDHADLLIRNLVRLNRPLVNSFDTPYLIDVA